MTLFFFLEFNSSISACLMEKIDDSEIEKTEETTRNKTNKVRRSVRSIDL